MPEARAAISAAVTGAITRSFEHHAREWQAGRIRWPKAAPDGPPGRDPARVPPVPEPLLDIRYDAGPAAALSWEAWREDPPYIILMVPPHWRRDIAHPGHAVLGGYPVLQALERDDPDGRPTEIEVVITVAHFDARLGGWTVTGVTGTRDVTWAGDGTYRVIRTERSLVW